MMEFLRLISMEFPDSSALPIEGVAERDGPDGLAPELLRGLPATLIVDVCCDEDSRRCLALLDELQNSVPVWIHEPRATVASSVMWMKMGAAYVLASIEEVEAKVRECRRLERITGAGPERRGRPTGSGLIGRSSAMARIEADIELVAERRCSVLIEGETGTGKEMVARAIHRGGSRGKGPWIAINCGAIPEALLEAELFGHVKGAFTGAVQARAGKFEIANHGSIFLDEIGDMPLATQGKLLRVLQEKEIERLGGNERVRLDVRVIAATNVDLEERVRQGLFRQDLFYRLNVFRIELPALRHRGDDIAMLAQHFADKICAAERCAPKRIDPTAFERLEAHSWPGNVRELENAIEAAVIVSGARPTLLPCDLRLSSRAGGQQAKPAGMEGSVGLSMPCPPLPHDGLDYQRTLEEFEKALLTQALTQSRGNKTAAACLLRMKRTTLAARMRVLETRRPRLVA